MHCIVVFTLPGSDDVDYGHVVTRASSFSYPVVDPNGCSNYHRKEFLCNGAVWLSHCIWNHSLAWKAPQPQLSDASEMIMLSWASALRGAKVDIPFQVETICYHHLRFMQNCWLMQMQVSTC